MRIIRPESNWIILKPKWRGKTECLQRLALHCGYRIGEMCAELDCSERYLHSVFIRDIGLPPKAWMRSERMVVARRKLIGGKSPEEVAMDLGFTSANNFRREFLSVHQVPPLRFQSENWGKPETGGGLCR